jgi:signal transduction histidine kinase
VERRLPVPVEAAAYFLGAEALTNVVRYARASRATVDISMDGDDLVVSVTDDGVGGVDLAEGSGLRGLQDRLATVDGTMEIVSRPGEGTRLTGRIPVVE